MEESIKTSFGIKVMLANIFRGFQNQLTRLISILITKHRRMFSYQKIFKFHNS